MSKAESSLQVGSMFSANTACSVSLDTTWNKDNEVYFFTDSSVANYTLALTKIKGLVTGGLFDECRGTAATGYYCRTSTGKANGCSWNGNYYAKASGGDSVASQYLENENKNLQERKASATDGENVDANKDLSLLKGLNKDISDYNKVRSQYDSNQDELNKHKKELEELEAKSGAGVQSIISEGVSTIGKSAITLVTTSMEASNNKGIMTGNCYLGDPANGNLFMVGGESKKLTWKLFN